MANRKSSPKKFLNKIPDPIKLQVVDIALEMTDKSPRELAWYITDTQGYFISESSVYRILKSYDLITSPHYHVMPAIFCSSIQFDKTLSHIRDFAQGRKLYISVDFDVLDPSFFAGVGSLSPTGLSLMQLLKLILVAIQVSECLIGIDLVEYNPSQDSGQISQITACRTISNLLTILRAKQKECIDQLAASVLTEL